MEDQAVHSPDSGEVDADLLRLFAAYPFSTDPMYQQGLAGILESGALNGKSEDEKTEILRRSQVFYFNRITGHSITVDDIVRSEQSLGETVPAAAIAAVAPSGTPPATTSDSDGSEIRTLTFAELKALIEQGNTDQIPNNRVIPNELHQAAPSESKAGMRKKPWEADNSADKVEASQ
ncbi:hypothetical protein AcW1_002514 [Taiwanofungus camphoratus]|nr:hypothetical protein AcV7_005427 [Antrodia cinnamomea]KAI0943323.1 hypothetical protein AcW1_002514 [Antrodia cinnamomea]